jgi:transcriptional regulator of acetoin/glycerol metabolism
MAGKLRCSFCGKSEEEIEKLVAGPAGIHICNECVALCQVIMAGEGEVLEPNFDPTLWPKERLLALLGPVNGAAELHRQHLQGIVETLRAQKVSWAAIARQLGVSRQTAWERFS